MSDKNVDYSKYLEHTYRGYKLIKEVYGGSWRIVEVKNGVVEVTPLGFARTIKEAKKKVDDHLQKKEVK